MVAIEKKGIECCGRICNHCMIFHFLNKSVKAVVVVGC